MAVRVAVRGIVAVVVMGHRMGIVGAVERLVRNRSGPWKTMNNRRKL